MGQSLRVEVIGDTKSYQRALNSAAGATKSFGHKAIGSISVLNAALGTGLVLAARSAFHEIGNMVDQATEAERSQAKLTQAFRNQKIAMDAASPAIQKLEEGARQLGFSDDEARESLTKLIQSGRDYAESTKELTVAQDVARASGQSLSDATTGLIRLQAGNTRAAKTYGIVLAPVTAAVDALKTSKANLTTEAGKELLAHAKIQDKLATGQAYYDALSLKVKGQGDAFSQTAAGGMARFHASLEQLEENLGGAIAPVLGKAAGALAGFVEKINAAPNATAKLKVAFEGVANVATGLFNTVKAAITAIDWNQVWSGIKVEAGGLIARVQASLGQADWGSVGRGIGDAIRKTIAFQDSLSGDLTKELAAAARKVDWTQFAKGLADGLLGSSMSDKLKNALLLNFKLMNRPTYEIGTRLGSRAGNALGDAFGSALPNKREVINQGLQKLGDNLNSKLKEVGSAAASVAAVQAGSIGYSMGAGVAGAFQAAVAGLAAAAVATINGIISTINAAMGIHSPSTVTAEKVGKPLGQGVVVGFAAGLLGSASAAGASVNTFITNLSQKITEARGTLASAFTALANNALAAFDTALANWKSPAQMLLDKLQLEDSINANAKAVADAQSAVDAAVAAADSAVAKEGETPEEFAARQAELRQAVVAAVDAQGAAERASIEFNLGLKEQQEQTAHEKQMAADRERFAGQLLLLQTELAKHPEEYAKTQRRIIALMKQYHVPMYNAGQLLASKFSDGLSDGIADVIRAARRLAAELEKIPGVGHVGSGTGGSAPGGSGASKPPDVGARSGSTQVTTVVNLDGREIARSTQKHLNRYKAANGTAGLS